MFFQTRTALAGLTGGILASCCIAMLAASPSQASPINVAHFAAAPSYAVVQQAHTLRPAYQTAFRTTYSMYFALARAFRSGGGGMNTDPAAYFDDLPNKNKMGAQAGWDLLVTNGWTHSQDNFSVQLRWAVSDAHDNSNDLLVTVGSGTANQGGTEIVFTGDGVIQPSAPEASHEYNTISKAQSRAIMYYQYIMTYNLYMPDVSRYSTYHKHSCPIYSYTGPPHP